MAATPPAAAAAAAAAKVRKKAKRQILDAVAHVHASFNNTIISITDRQGNTLVVGDRRQLRLQRLAQEHAVRGSGRGRAAGQRGERVRRQEPRSAREGPGPGTRVRGSCAELGRFPDHRDRRRDTDSPQRLPSAEEAASLSGRKHGEI